MLVEAPQTLQAPPCFPPVFSSTSQDIEDRKGKITGTMILGESWAKKKKRSPGPQSVKENSSIFLLHKRTRARIHALRCFEALNSPT